jgi:hypothetical protein
MTRDLSAEIAAATRHLDTLRAEHAEQVNTRRASVTPVYQFVLEPVEPNSWHEIYDDTCRLFRLSGRVTNEAELKAVGATVPMSGGMVYAYNTLTSRFITSVGGGTTFVRGESGAMRALGDWVYDGHPDGGDCTDVITPFRP